MKRTLLAITITALAIMPAAFCDSTDTSGGTQLNLTVGPEASFISSDASGSFSGDTKFGAKTVATNFNYKIRTSQTSGAGSITVLVTAFGTDGPALSDLTYACAVNQATSGCSGGTAVSTSAGTSVASFDPDTHSLDAGSSGAITWTLVDKPTVKTGSYHTVATYTISAS